MIINPRRLKIQVEGLSDGQDWHIVGNVVIITAFFSLFVSTWLVVCAYDAVFIRSRMAKVCYTFSPAQITAWLQKPPIPGKATLYLLSRFLNKN